jgi:hypothetical protein
MGPGLDVLRTGWSAYISVTSTVKPRAIARSRCAACAPRYWISPLLSSVSVMPTAGRRVSV